MRRLNATVQVDLDDFWAILSDQRKQCGGQEHSFFEKAMQRFLEIFASLKIKATFFVVGKDLISEPKKKMILRAFQLGHEIANHSFSHSPCFSALKSAEKDIDVKKGHDVIFEKTGILAAGFKAPNYNFSKSITDFLISEKYLYDSSLLPTPHVFLLRGLRKLILGKRENRTYLSSAFNGFAPLKIFPIYGRKQKHGFVYEAPGSVIPWLRVPFNMSYLLALKNRRLREGLFDFGIKLLTMHQLPLNYNFHLVDLADDKDMTYLPWLYRNAGPLAERIRLIRQILTQIQANYNVMPTRQFIVEEEKLWKKEMQ